VIFAGALQQPLIICVVYHLAVSVALAKTAIRIIGIPFKLPDAVSKLLLSQLGLLMSFSCSRC
jgi:hypothetical protein